MMPPNEISTTRCPVHAALEPRERPILFSAPMVRALLAGTKTQTRRVVKPQPKLVTDLWEPTVGGDRWIGTGPSPATGGTRQTWGWAPCPYGRPGDRLWVRETHLNWWKLDPANPAGPRLFSHVAAFAADGYELEPGERWIPSIHMLRAASRILLEITGVRVERLQDISEADAIAEGIERREDACGDWKHYCDSGTSVDAVSSYRSLWESINGEASWRANPWVWVVEFRRIVATNSIAARAHGTGAAAAFHEETR